MHRRPLRLFAALAACCSLAGCGRAEGAAQARAVEGDAASGGGASGERLGGGEARRDRAELVAPDPPPAEASSPDVGAGRAELTLLAGGDVSYGRLVGQLLLADPGHELFAALKPLFATADLRFANLESQLSDRGGETESPHNPLVFAGPPEGAASLARAGFDVVSLANNHALDYGRRALFETMGHLDRAGVRYAGAGRSRKAASAPLVVERGGFRLALLAVTDIWNHKPFTKNPDGDFVAGADADGLPAAVRALKRDRSIDFIAVSYHGGREFVPAPTARTRQLLRAALDAGADVAIGHHPHVAQGVEWRGGKPILYSLGNLLMQMRESHPWGELGYLARVRFARGEAPRVEACPFRAEAGLPRPLADDPQRGPSERQFFDRLEAISRPLGGTQIGAPGGDGCAPLAAPDQAPGPVAAKAR